MTQASTSHSNGKQLVLGLSGKIGSGKDTFADILCSRSPTWRKISFGEKMYEEVSEAFAAPIEALSARATKETPTERFAFGKSADKDFIDVMRANGQDLSVPRSPRDLLRQWGTEYRRAQDSEYWIRPVKQAILAHPATNYVVSDVRMPEEVSLINSMGGHMAVIHRDSAAGSSSTPSNHRTEGLVVDTFFHIKNDGQISDLPLKAIALQEALRLLANSRESTLESFFDQALAAVLKSARNGFKAYIDALSAIWTEIDAGKKLEILDLLSKDGAGLPCDATVEFLAAATRTALCATQAELDIAVMRRAPRISA